MSGKMKKNAKFNRENLQKRLVSVAEVMVPSSNALAERLRMAPDIPNFAKCVDSRLDIIMKHPDGQGRIKEGARRFFHKKSIGETAPFVLKGEEIADWLGKLGEERAFKEAVSLVLRSLYNTSDSAFSLELLKTFVKMQEVEFRSAMMFANRAILTAQKYPEYSVGMVSAFRGPEFLGALNKMGRDRMFGPEFERIIWKLGSESGDAGMVETVSRVAARLFSEKRDRLTAYFLGCMEAAWDQSNNPVLLKEGSRCSGWIAERHGDAEIGKFLAYMEGLSKSIDFSEGGKEGLLYLLAMEVSEGGNADWLVKHLMDQEREKSLVEFCGYKQEFIEEYRKEISGAGRIDAGFLDEFIAAPISGGGPRTPKLPERSKEEMEKEREDRAYRIIKGRSSLPPRKRANTPRFEEMGEKDRLRVDFYKLGTGFGRKYEEMLEEAEQEGSGLEEFCSHYGELLHSIASIRDSGTLWVARGSETIDLREDFIRFSEDLFAGMDTSLADAKFAFRVVGEMVESDYGATVIEGFVEQLKRIKDTNALAGICKYNRPAPESGEFGGPGN